MAKFVGIDIRSNAVRAVQIRTAFRRVVFESLSEIDRSQVETLEQAVQACALPLVQHADAVSVAVEGEFAFIHRLVIPGTAEKQLEQVIPFELEAQVPVDFEELVYDFVASPRKTEDNEIEVMTASARTESVRERIRVVREATGHEPERVGCGALPLSNLAAVIPELDGDGAVAILDLGDTRSEVVVLMRGHPMYARTLDIGVAGLPQSATRLASQLRQTFVSAGTRGGAPVHTVYLAGGGASAPGAEAYLSSELGVAVGRLPLPSIEGIQDQNPEALPKFVKALGLAIGLRSGPRDPDLRRGALSYQRGYAFLKEKIPLLVGLGATVLVSFFFSSWAQLRVLADENVVLADSLAQLSKTALGVETTDPDEVQQTLERLSAVDRDPMPTLDAFDVMVELSKAVPTTIVHDVDELDFQREHVKLRGVVGTTAEAQQVADNLKKNECFKGVKIGKVTQAVNSARQKYVLEFDVECPNDQPKKKKKAGE